MYMKMRRWKKVTARCLLLLCTAAIALPAQAAHADEVKKAVKARYVRVLVEDWDA